MKRTPLKRGHRGLRRRSKNPRKTLLLKADSLLQDYYRDVWVDKPCEGCGGKMELVHHFVLKSHSNRLRFEKINLIPVCKICHSKVHGFHGELINADIIMRRGKQWLNYLRLLERERINLGIKDLEKIIEKYKI